MHTVAMSTKGGAGDEASNIGSADPPEGNLLQMCHATPCTHIACAAIRIDNSARAPRANRVERRRAISGKPVQLIFFCG